MQRSSSARKPRGISVSLTNKSNQSHASELKPINITPFVINSPNKPVHVESRVVQHRPQIQYRNISDQKVNFSYTSTVKNSSIQEGIILDRQILELKRELADKKAQISKLEDDIYKQKLIPGSQRKEVKVHPKQQIKAKNICINQQIECEKPQKFIQNEVNYIDESKNQGKILKQAQNLKKKIFSIEQTNKEKKQIHEKQNKEPSLQIQNCQISRKELEQRYKQLKWAQSKVLDLIKVCEEGL